MMAASDVFWSEREHAVEHVTTLTEVERDANPVAPHQSADDFHAHGQTITSITSARAQRRVADAGVTAAPGRRSHASDYVAASTDFTTQVSVDAAYDHCRRVAQRVARTFYYGSLFLPREKRRASWALYAFCRTADDIADEPNLYPDPGAALAGWREALADAYAGQPRGPVMTAWTDLLTRYDVPIAPALDLLKGIEMDIAGTQIVTFEDLRLYCYRVAGTVGLLMTPVLGYHGEAALGAAVDLGIGMQLTNILRDIGEDAAAGRVYLPSEEMARFGYSREELLRGVINPAFCDLIRFHITRAEEYYARGMRGVALLSAESQLAIALSATLYRAILRRIEDNHYDVFSQRAHISFPRKLAAIPGTWLRLQRAQPE